MVASAQTPLRALVVEDEWPARNYLVELLECSRLAEVVGAVGSVDEATQALGADPPGVGVDVAFVDVALDGAARGESGLSLVRAVAGTPSAPMFVLATAYEKHALEAFELGVVDYLLKPFSEERVVQCLRRLHQRHASKATVSGPPRIVARRKRSLVFLEPHEIWAFEAADRLTFVHTMHGTFDIDLSLAAVEASFGRAFVRVHRNWLVNAGHIKELERDGHETKLFVGAGVADTGKGVRVPVARERSAAVRDMLLTNATGL
ncbi:MAG TPA: LytTR family DNA-binding domain-containing protein, partial [Polyangiaceae bacterium]|nr:LytTR family DNA-binding domain-containing protein [Polyangiaceae bacterium]